MSRKREQGDAIVVFGITGDLAFKHIIPALQRMVQAGELKVPVVGVAREHWTAERLGERMRNSLMASAEGLDPAAHEKLSTLVRYVWGTYDDPRTYVALRDALGGARCPVHYLAIPPELFPTVIDQLGGVGLAQRGRVVVEKPFGRDLESSRTLNTARAQRACRSRAGTAGTPLVDRGPRAGQPPFQHRDRMEELPAPRRSGRHSPRIGLDVHAHESTIAIFDQGTGELSTEIGEWERFDHPDQLSAYLGIVPSEHTTSSQRRQGSITKAGSTHARRLLIEASYHYRRHPGVGELLERRQRDQPPEVINIAWSAQRRLHARWRQLKDARKKPNGVVAVAIARELACFCWEIATWSGSHPDPGSAGVDAGGRPPHAGTLHPTEAGARDGLRPPTTRCG